MWPTRRSSTTSPASSVIRTAHPGTGLPTSISSTASGPAAVSTARPRLSAARSRASGRATSPGGGKVTASVASARPYTGCGALAASPVGRIRPTKARHTAGEIGSAPTRIIRTRVRSRRASVSCGTRRSTRARAKLAAESRVARWRAAASSHRAGLLANVRGSSRTCLIRADSGTRWVPISPMSWKYGIQVATTSSEVMPAAARICARLASTAACVSSTPLGAPVLPEENWRNATSSGARSGSRRGAGCSRSPSSVRERTGWGRASSSGAVASPKATGGRPRNSHTGSTRRTSGASGTGTSPAATAPQKSGRNSSLRSAGSSTWLPGARPAARNPPATHSESESSARWVTTRSPPSPCTRTIPCPGAASAAPDSTSSNAVSPFPRIDAPWSACGRPSHSPRERPPAVRSGLP